MSVLINPADLTYETDLEVETSLDGKRQPGWAMCGPSRRMPAPAPDTGLFMGDDLLLDLKSTMRAQPTSARWA
ncbi:hypothetical protein [Streptomyces sp. bgisy084]|uniref:hypothetical protein n=1 Tax=unclassified Streptomyces TaxID=2593676 RepID=UPI003D74DC09